VVDFQPLEAGMSRNGWELLFLTLLNCGLWFLLFPHLDRFSAKMGAFLLLSLDVPALVAWQSWREGR